MSIFFHTSPTERVQAIPNPCASYDTQQPTTEQSDALQKAFDYFNEKLFARVLPPLLLTLHKHRYKALGFYAPKYWERSDSTIQIDEICISPQHLRRPLKDIMGTLVHEMCHHFQFHFGKSMPSRGYHNWEFAHIMEALGLITSSTGQPEGKRVGRKMSHYIQPNGMFETVFEDMPEELTVPFIIRNSKVYLPSKPDLKANAPEAKEKNKVKYTCPDCELNVWAKPRLYKKLLCIDCDQYLA